MPLRIVTLLLSFAALIGCRQHSEPNQSAAPLVVAVSVAPHAWLVQQIGGEKVHVEVLVPQGKEPETYQVTPDKLAALSKAKLYFRTGMPFENALLPKLQAVAKGIQLVDLRECVPKKIILYDHHHDHHGHAYGHVDEIDPHTWFAPQCLHLQADYVLHALKQIMPTEAEFFQTNRKKLAAQILAAEETIGNMLKPVRGKPVFVLHPAYGYFCNEFGLKQRAIEFEGKQPKPQQIAALIDEIEKLSKPPAIFVQPEFHPSSAQALADAVGAKLVIHSPLDYDVLQSMIHFAEQLAK